MSITSIIDIMAQKSILTLLAALVVGILFVFSQTAEAAKGPIVTNKVSFRLPLMTSAPL
jgi:uncharacterized membrane protein YjgN (DUF898 family)